MKRDSTSVIVLSVLLACLASTASALADGLLKTWLDFVDSFGIALVWKNIYYYTFMFPFTLFYCGLGLDA